MLYQAHTNLFKTSEFLKISDNLTKIKILSEGIMITNFISKSLEFIELLICEKIAEVFFV